MEGFHENHRRDDRWPQLLRLERSDAREGRLGACREARQSAAVQDEHGSTDSAERPITDPPSDGISGCLLALAGLADLGGEFVKVVICFRKRILAFQFRTKRDLQELGGREPTLL